MGADLAVRQPPELPPFELYVAAFAAREHSATRARLLVTDDGGYDALAALIDARVSCVVNVFDAAERSAALARSSLRASEPLTAMVCRDLAALPPHPLPAGVTLRPVRRLGADTADGVPLDAAVAAMRRADPDAAESHDELVAILRALPGAYALFAAVDPGGAIVATSGAGVFGGFASVIFVSTDPVRRGQGLGLAVTAAALRAAQLAGARTASLDASAAGRPIYERLGFEAVGATRHYVAG